MKKILSIIIVSIFIVSLVSGCADKTNNDASSTQVSQEGEGKDEKSTLKVFLQGLDHTTYLKPVNEAFQEEYPNIKLEFDSPGSSAYETVLKTKIATDEAPDAMSLWPGGLMADYVAKGHLKDLTSQPYLERFTEDAIQAYSLKGKVYGVAFNSVAEGLFYSKKIFNDLSIKEPANWDEFLAACEKIKKNGITPLASGFKDDWTIIRFVNAAFPPLIYGPNPDFNEKLIAGEAKFNTEEGLEVYQKLMTLVDKDYFDANPLSTDYNLANALFTSGETAMLIQGGWALSALRDANPDMDLGFMPLPANDPGEEMLGCWHVEIGMGMSSKTKNADAVNKYFDFVTSPEQYKTYISGKKVYSVVKDVNINIDPTMDEFVENWVLTGKCRTWAHDIWSNSMINNWKKKLQEVVSKQITPEEMVEWLDEEYENSENFYK